MRGLGIIGSRAAALCAPLAALALAGACGAPPAGDQRSATAAERSDRRLFDGAPPVIPHPATGPPCMSCHDRRGVAVAGLGHAPPSPHGSTLGIGDTARCRQCHVESGDAPPFARSTFVGWRSPGRGERFGPGAPPTMPHAIFMREACRACHTGPAARAAIRTDHPERARCRQCHLDQRDSSRLAAGPGTATP